MNKIKKEFCNVVHVMLQLKIYKPSLCIPGQLKPGLKRGPKDLKLQRKNKVKTWYGTLSHMKLACRY